jgi:hypothetical protein
MVTYTNIIQKGSLGDVTNQPSCLLIQTSVYKHVANHALPFMYAGSSLVLYLSPSQWP